MSNSENQRRFSEDNWADQVEGDHGVTDGDYDDQDASDGDDIDPLLIGSDEPEVIAEEPKFKVPVSGVNTGDLGSGSNLKAKIPEGNVQKGNGGEPGSTNEHSGTGNTGGKAGGDQGQDDKGNNGESDSSGPVSFAKLTADSKGGLRR